MCPPEKGPILQTRLLPISARLNPGRSTRPRSVQSWPGGFTKGSKDRDPKWSPSVSLETNLKRCLENIYTHTHTWHDWIMLEPLDNLCIFKLVGSCAHQIHVQAKAGNQGSDCGGLFDLPERYQTPHPDLEEEQAPIIRGSIKSWSCHSRTKGRGRHPFARLPP